jgi:hypothetical protein
VLFLLWRRGSGSNRRKRLCRPLHNHFATPPRERIVTAYLERCSRVQFEVLCPDSQSGDSPVELADMLQNQSQLPAHANQVDKKGKLFELPF